jgi:hypothetical protein
VKKLEITWLIRSKINLAAADKKPEQRFVAWSAALSGR